MASTRLRMVVLEAQGGAVLGVAWPLPSSSASVPLYPVSEPQQAKSMLMLAVLVLA